MIESAFKGLARALRTANTIDVRKQDMIPSTKGTPLAVIIFLNGVEGGRVMEIAIIDYGVGNLRSASKALEHVAPKIKVQVTSDRVRVKTADYIVLPGMGPMPISPITCGITWYGRQLVPRGMAG